MFKKIIITGFVVMAGKNVFAQSSVTKNGQEINTITTAVPFVRINVDARSGGMGDVGLATTPDNNSDFHNPAKSAFLKDDYGIGISYTPWLRQLVNDIHLINANGYYKIGEQQTIGAQIRFFSLGEIQFRQDAADPGYTSRPNELAFDVHYARQMSKKFSAAVSLRYIRSNLAAGYTSPGGVSIKPGNAVAADLAFYYKTPVKLGDKQSEVSLGLNLSNIGNKMNYTSASQKDFIPANFGLGAGWNIDIDDYNRIGVYCDINKLLVPTMPIRSDFTTQQAYEDELTARRNQSTVKGIISSWSDAPGGSKEELKEINVGGGVEYGYNKLFFVRGGYFHEPVEKGGRSYATAGVGLKYTIFDINFSYLIPTNTIKTPLDNTMRFSLLFNFKKSGGSTKTTAPNTAPVKTKPVTKSIKKIDGEESRPSQETIDKSNFPKDEIKSPK